MINIDATSLKVQVMIESKKNSQYIALIHLVYNNRESSHIDSKHMNWPGGWNKSKN